MSHRTLTVYFVAALNYLNLLEITKDKVYNLTLCEEMKHSMSYGWVDINTVTQVTQVYMHIIKDDLATGQLYSQWYCG